MQKLESREWWPELIAAKDDMSLRELAARFGVSAAAISIAFKRNGITRTAAASGPKKGTGGRPRKAAKPKRAGAPRKTPSMKRDVIPRRSKLARYRDQMGKVVDREIAEMAGVTTSAVTNYRKRHNIKAAVGRGRPRRRPEAAAPARRRGTLYGYRVLIGKDAYVVVARNITEAAKKATASRRGVVKQIELLGRAIS